MSSFCFSKLFIVSALFVTVLSAESDKKWLDQEAAHLLEAVKSDYIDSSKLFKKWISRENVSKKDVDYFFTLIKENLDIYRYKNNAYQKAEILARFKLR